MSEIILNETMKTILNRRSTKAFKQEKITEQELATILEAGKYAPSGRGLQATKMVVVQNPQMLAKLSKMNADIMGVDSDPFYGAPTVVIVLADSNVTTCVEDGSLVIGNMYLAATSIGVGACWIHRERQMFDSPEGKALLQEWDIAPSYIGVGACALGYAAKEPAPAKARKEDFVVRI